jgi:hypothetical protein
MIKFIHDFNIKSLDEAIGLLYKHSKNFRRKKLEYSLIGITNILIKTYPEHIFTIRVNLVQLLLENSNLERFSDESQIPIPTTINHMIKHFVKTFQVRLQ